MAKKHDAKAPQTEALEEIPAGGELQEGSLDEMFAEDAGAGMQGVGPNDLAIPFLVILQKGSPQVGKANAKYVKGAEQGAIFNTVSQELFDGQKGVLVVPCGYSKMVVEWTPRDSGGGFIAQHRENDPILKECKRNERGQLVHPATNHVFIDTAYHFCLLLREDGPPGWALVSMYSTQLKKSRIWNTTMRGSMIKGPHGAFNPPSFSHRYRLTTVGEAKDTYDWMGWKIVSEGRVEDVELYKMAREFSKQVEAGAVRVTAPPQDFEEATVTEEVPF